MPNILSHYQYIINSIWFNNIRKQTQVPLYFSWLATTKFQPSDARKAYPNFDEPRFKSTFTITLKHWENFTALGNMPPEVTNNLRALSLVSCIRIMLMISCSSMDLVLA